jgi:hypothetical protein
MKEVGEAHRFSSLPLHRDELGRIQESEPIIYVLHIFHPQRATLVYFFHPEQICKNLSYVERYRMHDLQCQDMPMNRVNSAENCCVISRSYPIILEARFDAWLF